MSLFQIRSVSGPRRRQSIMRTSELDALLRETVDEIRTIPFIGELL